MLSMHPFDAPTPEVARNANGSRKKQISRLPVSPPPCETSGKSGAKRLIQRRDSQGDGEAGSREIVVAAIARPTTCLLDAPASRTRVEWTSGCGRDGCRNKISGFPV